MSKPILFTTITRDEYDALIAEGKATYNYQIIEDNGSITKVISGLEETSLNYTFDFDINIDGETITVTPRTGVTYEAITAALEKTPNVYSNIYFSETSFMRGLFNNVASNAVDSTGIMYTDLFGPSPIFAAARLRIQNNDSANIVIKPISE